MAVITGMRRVGKTTALRYLYGLVDNGPELISQRLEKWAKEKQIELLHIRPGKPAQNAYIESFNRIFREDVLDAYLFDDLEEVRQIKERWLENYNAISPHEALQVFHPANLYFNKLEFVYF